MRTRKFKQRGWNNGVYIEYNHNDLNKEGIFYNLDNVPYKTAGWTLERVLGWLSQGHMIEINPDPEQEYILTIDDIFL